MVRVSSFWHFTQTVVRANCQNGDGGGSWVGEKWPQTKRHQNHQFQSQPFSLAGAKSQGLPQKERSFARIKEEGRGTRTGYEASKGSKGISGL